MGLKTTGRIVGILSRYPDLFGFYEIRNVERAELGIERDPRKRGVASGVRVEHPGLCFYVILPASDWSTHAIWLESMLLVGAFDWPCYSFGMQVPSPFLITDFMVESRGWAALGPTLDCLGDL